VMLDFYDALQVCVERNLCDRDLAVRLFQSYAVPFWDQLGAQIVASRTESDPNMGGGLQWMADLPLPAPLTEVTSLDAPPEPAPEPAAETAPEPAPTE